MPEQVIKHQTITRDTDIPRRSVRFENCHITGRTLKNCEFDNCELIDVFLRKCVVRSSTIKEAVIKDSTLEACSNTLCTIYNSIVRDSGHFYCNFSGSTIYNGGIANSTIQGCSLHSVNCSLSKIARSRFENSPTINCELHESVAFIYEVANSLYYLASKAGVVFFRDSAGELWGTIQRSTLRGGKGQYTKGFVEKEGYFEIPECTDDKVCGPGKHGALDAAYYHSPDHTGKELWAMTFKMKDLIACDGFKVKVRAGYMHRVGPLPWVGEP